LLFCLLPWDATVRKPLPDAGAILLDFLTSRTVRNKILFFVNYSRVRYSVRAAKMDRW
jgi:hypothetical protein